MTFTRLVMSITFTTLLAVAFTACKDDPTSTGQAPGKPASVVAVSLDVPNTTGFEVRWSAPVDSASLTGYRIWWQVAPAGAKDSADVAATMRSYSVTGVKVGESYVVTVAARRGDLFSAPATASWGGARYPAPPAALQVSFANATTAHLSWTASADADITGYRLSRRMPGQADSSVIDLSSTTLGADIPNLDQSRSYTFQVQSRRNGLLSSTVVAEWGGAQSVPPARPTGLTVVSLSNTSVKLTWQASNDSGAITYRVGWVGKNVADSGSMESAATEATVTGLKVGKLYSFSVAAMRGTAVSTPIAVDGAPATRYTDDASGAGLLRMYETESSYNSMLVLDPTLGGPKRVSYKYQPLGDIQLAIYTSSQDPYTFSVGPAYAFVEYRNSDQYDRTVFISDSSYSVLGLDSWIYAGSIDTRIPNDGNVRSFTFPITQTEGKGQGFFVRTGSPGSYHYARILIKNAEGKLLQGDAPNRYVEVAISYQTAANIPFAKPAGNYARGNVASTRRR